MIKHFYKWLKLVPLSDCNNEGTTYAILDKVFNRFDTLIKIFTNQGMKIREEFQELCEKSLINHHMISWDHFEVDMLVEQMVQTMKLCVHILLDVITWCVILQVWKMLHFGMLLLEG
jgi:hypothetical protein